MCSNCPNSCYIGSTCALWNSLFNVTVTLWGHISSFILGVKKQWIREVKESCRMLIPKWVCVRWNLQALSLLSAVLSIEANKFPGCLALPSSQLHSASKWAESLGHRCTTSFPAWKLVFTRLSWSPASKTPPSPPLFHSLALGIGFSSEPLSPSKEEKCILGIVVLKLFTP